MEDKNNSFVSLKIEKLYENTGITLGVNYGMVLSSFKRKDSCVNCRQRAMNVVEQLKIISEANPSC